MCKGSTADSDSVCEGSNPSPAASKRSETNGFQTSVLVSDPLFDPLTVLGLLIDSAPHIGFHAVCAVLFHFFRGIAIYVVPRSLLGTARKAAPPNGGAALRQRLDKPHPCHSEERSDVGIRIFLDRNLRKTQNLCVLETDCHASVRTGSQ